MQDQWSGPSISVRNNRLISKLSSNTGAFFRWPFADFPIPQSRPAFNRIFRDPYPCAKPVGRRYWKCHQLLPVFLFYDGKSFSFFILAAGFISGFSFDGYTVYRIFVSSISFCRCRSNRPFISGFASLLDKHQRTDGSAMSVWPSDKNQRGIGSLTTLAFHFCLQGQPWNPALARSFCLLKQSGDFGAVYLPCLQVNTWLNLSLWYSKPDMPSPSDLLGKIQNGPGVLVWNCPRFQGGWTRFFRRVECVNLNSSGAFALYHTFPRLFYLLFGNRQTMTSSLQYRQQRITVSAGSEWSKRLFWPGRGLPVHFEVVKNRIVYTQPAVRISNRFCRMRSILRYAIFHLV